MSTKIAPAEVTKKISDLLKTFMEAADARRELGRLLGREWVDHLQETIDAERTVCTVCALDFDEVDITEDDTCWDCAKTKRIESVGK